MPNVSVIIPTYNRAKYLPEAVDSVLNQTYQDFEIIIVDDGSTDKTQEIIEKYTKNYSDKICYFYQQNKGASAARNKGLKEAKGQYIAFLDSDDLWLPEKLAKQINILEKDYCIDLVYTSGQLIDCDGNIYGKKPAVPVTEVDDFLRGGRIPNMTALVRQKCFKQVGGFDTDLMASIDTDLWIRICCDFNCYHLDEILALFRKHDTNISSNLENVYKGHIRIFKKLIESKQFNTKKQTLNLIMAQNEYLLGKLYYKKKKYNKSIKHILRALNCDLLFGKAFWSKEDSSSNMLFKLFKPYFLLLLNILLVIDKIINKKINIRYKNNILFYESSSGFGGSANSLSNLVNYLDKNKFYPIIALKNYGALVKKVKNTKIIKLRNYTEPTRLSNFKLLFYIIYNIIPEIISVYCIIRKNKISIIHINTNIFLGIPAIIASKMNGIPCVCHIRETRRLIKRERLFAKWVDKFIVLNKDAYEMYKIDIPEEKIKIIYNGVDLDEFAHIESGKFRKEFNLDSSSIIGLVGRIIQGKGQKEFILAAKEVLKTKPNVKFIIIGDTIGYADEYYKEVKELVRKDNLDKSIFFSGWINDVKNIIADLDISVLATTTFPEGLPNAIIEAMALAKPVVATNVPGPSDIVVDGITGYLVPSGDIKAMAKKIIYFLDNRNIAETMGKEGRERVEKLFNIKKQIGEIKKIYEELLS